MYERLGTGGTHLRGRIRILLGHPSYMRLASCIVDPATEILDIYLPKPFKTLLDALASLAGRPSLTKLSLHWGVLDIELATHRILGTTSILSVTHIHIPNPPPHYGLGALLSFFPNVTHLRLSATSYLQDLLPAHVCLKLESLTLDSPPFKNVCSPLCTQVNTLVQRLCITTALKKRALQYGRHMGLTKIVINVGTNLPLGWTWTANLCARFCIFLELRAGGYIHCTGLNTVPASLWQHLCTAFLVKFPAVRWKF
jgi:hypothetical protein